MVSVRKSRTNPLLTSIAKWLLLNSKAGAIVALVLTATNVVGFGAASIQSLRLHQAQAALIPLAKQVGEAEGQLKQLAADSTRRETEAKAAQAAADALARVLSAKAKTILSAEPTNPKDLCLSADALIRQEIAEAHNEAR